MNLVRYIDFLRDRLRLVIGFCIALLALIAAADVVRWFLSRGHEVAAAHAAPAAHGAAHGTPQASGFLTSLYHIAETVPVFWSVFGFVACVLIVVLSKAFGHMKVGPNTEIMTREDYYNE
jgi:hypothetical protein